MYSLVKKLKKDLGSTFIGRLNLQLKFDPQMGM